MCNCLQSCELTLYVRLLIFTELWSNKVYDPFIFLPKCEITQ